MNHCGGLFVHLKYYGITFRDDRVIDLFRELPDHRGCSAAELDAAEADLGVCFPARYRAMMELDATRLCGAGIVAPLHRLNDFRQEADGVLIEDGHLFRLERADVVFAWDGIFAFYFFNFNADGTDDPAVKMFNYYDSADDWKPVVSHDTLTAYFTDGLRRYLKLD